MSTAVASFDEQSGTWLQ